MNTGVQAGFEAWCNIIGLTLGAGGRLTSKGTALRQPTLVRYLEGWAVLWPCLAVVVDARRGDVGVA